MLNKYNDILEKISNGADKSAQIINITLYKKKLLSNIELSL